MAASPLTNTSANQSRVQADAGWHKADPKRVCMVTNMEFPRDQIPVKVKDTTYYGCCENCKERLGKDEAVRQAVDPISGKTVDKAKASIAAGPDGAVEYFENDANLKKFIASQK
ncbi:MAG: TRASH domain-containing protein [Proteobacteria bacterium]|nr:MAG: TRASH domain-containing protein [Pseudomonadota bacterium]